MTEEQMRSPSLRTWRANQGFAVLRLRKAVVGASRIPVRNAGDVVFATWSPGLKPLAKGWVIQKIGFLCVMNEPDVEVLETP